MIKAVYIVCVAIQQTVFVAGSAWLTFSGGNAWWLIGGVALCLLSGDGFSRRMNSWGDFGNSDPDQQ